METVKSLILAMAYVIIVTQTAPISVNSYKKKSLFGRSNPLDSFGALFFNLIPDRSSRADQERLNMSLPASKNAKPDFTVEPAKSMFTKFSHLISVPVAHPLENYTIIVVTAPPNIKLRSGETEPLIVYLVFDDSTTSDSRAPSMPEVYFVTQRDGQVDLAMKQKKDQIWIINNNRTVTGIKSKDVAKFVNFTTQRKRNEAIVRHLMGP